MIGYRKHIEKCKNKEDIKDIINILSNDANVGDSDFDNIIYDYIIPKLESLGCDLDRDNNTNYENVVMFNF